MNTRGSAVVLGVAAVALLAHFSTALGAGKITGLTLNLPAVKTCVLETIRVTGTGRCSTFTVQLDDGTALVHVPGDFPTLVYHAYSKQGTYRPTAQGQGNCSGTESAILQVVGPAITSTYLSSAVRPGGGVIVQGENFGNLPGQLLIHLTRSGQQLDFPLQDLQWGDSFAAGTIPFVVGVVDQQVTFTVVAQCGAVSNAWTANFTATRDFELLQFNRITCTSYPGLSNNDQCQNTGGVNWPAECGVSTTGLEHDPSGFQGYHASGYGIHGNLGNDQFYATLANGWVLDSVTPPDPILFGGGVLDWVKIGNGSRADVAQVIGAGTSNPQVNVEWYVDNCGLIEYFADFSITGPLGVPW
jgi:hypothetical protein